MKRALFLPAGNLTKTRKASLLEKHCKFEAKQAPPAPNSLTCLLIRSLMFLPLPQPRIFVIFMQNYAALPSTFCDVKDVSRFNYLPCENTFHSRQMAAGWDNFSFSGNLKTYRDHMLYRIAYAMSVQPQSIFPCRNRSDF